MAQLTDELKNIPIKITRGGKTITNYLSVTKIKEEIEKSYKLFLEMTEIKKMFYEKKIYKSKEIQKEEQENFIKIEKIEEVNQLPESFMNQLENTKEIKKIYNLKKELIHREKYLIQEIIEDINITIQKNNPEIYDLKKKEMFCCYENLTSYESYYKLVEESVQKKIFNIIEELKELNFYSLFFFRKGNVLKRKFNRNRTFFIETKNAGIKKYILYKHLFLTYISGGPLVGEKHEFNDSGICNLSGENRNSILEKEYTDNEYNNLIDVLINKNIRKIIDSGNDKEIEKIDENELKEDTEANLEKITNKFIDNISKILNKSKNKDFEKTLKERIENLGVYRKKNETERLKLEYEKSKHYAIDIIEFENNRYREKINNLKNYINQYFRKYISMVINHYDYTDYIDKIKDVTDEISKEIQKFIYNENDFIKKYITKKNAETFSKLDFNISLSNIDNLVAKTDIWSSDYKKIKKIVNFNLCHLSEALLYILIENLNKFITIDFGKKREDMENNIVIAQFILDMFDKIYEDQSILDKPSNSVIINPAKEINITEDKETDKIRDQQTKALSDFKYKLGKTTDINDYEQVYDNIEQNEKEEMLKEKFIENYKGKYDKAPNTSEITDYLETELQEEKVNADINVEEFSFSQLKQEAEDALDIGDGYGELEQGIEDDDN